MQQPGEGHVLDFTSSQETVGVSLPPVMRQYVQSVVDNHWEKWRKEGWVGGAAVGVGGVVVGWAGSCGAGRTAVWM